MNYYRMVKSDAGRAAGILSRMRPTGPGDYPEWAVATDYLNKLSLVEGDENSKAFDEIIKAGELSMNDFLKDLGAWQKHSAANRRKAGEAVWEAAHMARDTADRIQHSIRGGGGWEQPRHMGVAPLLPFLLVSPAAAQHVHRRGNSVAYRSFLSAGDSATVLPKATP